MSEQISAESFDSQLDAVSHLERRRLLLALLDATRNDETPVDASTIESDADQRTLEMQMTHVHLPKLEAAGYVDRRRENGSDRGQYLVSEGPRFDGIRPFLELLEANRELLPRDLK